MNEAERAGWSHFGLTMVSVLCGKTGQEVQSFIFLLGFEGGFAHGERADIGKKETIKWLESHCDWPEKMMEKKLKTHLQVLRRRSHTSGTYLLYSHHHSNLQLSASCPAPSRAITDPQQDSSMSSILSSPSTLSPGLLWLG